MSRGNYTGFRTSLRIYRHHCDAIDNAGAQRNHREESRAELGPFGLGVLHMDIDASWAGDQKNKEIYIPGAKFCPYCGVNIKVLLDKANIKRGETTPY